MTVADPDSLPVGTVVGHGRYRLVQFVGRGGFGVVYRAEDLVSGGVVAIKECLPLDTAQRAADGRTVVARVTGSAAADFAKLKHDLLREGERLRTVRHPGIVEVKELFEEAGTIYLVLEFCDGMTLDAARAIRPRWDSWEVVDLVRRLEPALSHLHAAGLLHRDLKPQNIMLVPQLGAPPRPVLIDFGISRSVLEATHTFTKAGSMGFAALEQETDVHGREGPATDVHGVAGVALSLLTGRSRLPAAVQRVARPEDGLASELSEVTRIAGAPMAAALRRALALKVGERTPSVRRLVSDLETALLARSASGARPVGLPMRMGEALDRFAGMRLPAMRVRAPREPRSNGMSAALSSEMSAGRTGMVTRLVPALRTACLVHGVLFLLVRVDNWRWGSQRDTMLWSTFQYGFYASGYSKELEVLTPVIMTPVRLAGDAGILGRDLKQDADLEHDYPGVLPGLQKELQPGMLWLIFVNVVAWTAILWGLGAIRNRML